MPKAPANTVENDIPGDIQTRLGDRMRALRIARGFSSENFAHEINIARAQYSRYEQGQDIRFSSLVKVVKGFKITLKEFFSEGFD